MAIESSDSRSRNSKREKLRSALAHRRAADQWLDNLAESQTQWNAVAAKLDNDTAGALDTDYAVGETRNFSYEADGEGSDAQHKRSLREVMRSAFAHKKLADEMVDALEEQQAAMDALLEKLDDQAGTLTETDFADELAVEALDGDAEGADAQHKASFRRSLRSALADRRLADEMLDGISGLQSAINSSLALLDAGTVNGAHLVNQISVLDPDSE